MATTNAVWGIDIGQCSLKAMQCVPGENGKLKATAFDYIEYPKILSQPDANPEELVKEALEQFLSRNEVKGDKVAISVSGQAGLSRSFKPPPVDAKTLPDLVKFEARQVIPFALEDVIWDFQLIGGKVVDGITVDAEVGLFAMKREAVFKALQPFLDADIEVDIVQLSPLTIYNVVLSDVLTELPDPDDIDPANPPESLVVISMGTDTTDLVITDGFKLWQRNIPIGGNHFTKQLSRELKLTYAKAEHLKRNARKAEDPKTIFQAMRPVFSDLVTELQRSISYFQGLERSARIGHVAMFGNASNLPGLRQFLNKHLGVELAKFTDFKKLEGDEVTKSKQFQENILSYATCYGLCLQGQEKGRLKTNLLPQEFVTERLIRAKKPWALAAVGALLLALTGHYFFTYMAWREVHETSETDGVSWGEATSNVTSVDSRHRGFVSKDQEQMIQLAEVHEMENAVAGVTDGRRLWSEMLTALHQMLPPYAAPTTHVTDAEFEQLHSTQPVDPNVVPYLDRPDIYIEYVETEYFANLQSWYSDGIRAAHELDMEYIESRKPEEEVDEADANGTNSGGPPQTGGFTPGGPNPGANQGTANAGTGQGANGPTGPGWVIELKGYHYFNGETQKNLGTGAGNYVRETVIQRIMDDETKSIWLPMPPGSAQKYMKFSPKELGLSFPVIVVDPGVDYNYRVPNVNHPDYQDNSGTGPGAGGPGAGGPGAGGPGAGGPGAGGPGAGGPGNGPPGNGDGEDAEADDEPLDFEAPKYEFVLQIVWQPVGLSERLENRAKNQARADANSANAPVNQNTQPNPGPQGNQPNNNAANATDPQNGDPQNADPQNGDPQNGDPQNGDPQNGDPQNVGGAADDQTDTGNGGAADTGDTGTGDGTGGGGGGGNGGGNANNNGQ